MQIERAEPPRNDEGIFETTNKVAVIDTRTLEVVRQVPVRGKLPFWLAVG